MYHLTYLYIYSAQQHYLDKMRFIFAAETSIRHQANLERLLEDGKHVSALILHVIQHDLCMGITPIFDHPGCQYTRAISDLKNTLLIMLPLDHCRSIGLSLQGNIHTHRRRLKKLFDRYYNNYCHSMPSTVQWKFNGYTFHGGMTNYFAVQPRHILPMSVDGVPLEILAPRL